MSIAKAVTNGYFPFGAAMISGRVAEAFETSRTQTGFIGHGYTYSGHPVGAAAAMATLAETRRLDVAANAAARGSELIAGLRELATRHALVGEVRGQGLMCALELVTDRARKTAAPKETLQRLFDATYAAGVMVRVSGPNVILSPPLVITSADVARILAALDSGLKAAG
jgi:adenosylmethionine-8-amino-7-oxononanoate aminotransferase